MLMIPIRYVASIIFLLLTNAELIASALSEKEIIFNVHNVGQGNCITLKGPEWTMLIDAGSTSYTPERFYGIYEKVSEKATLNQSFGSEFDFFEEKEKRASIASLASRESEIDTSYE